MAENELLDLLHHASWRRVRQMVAAGDPPSEIAQAVLDEFQRKLRKVRPATIHALICAVRAGDTDRLRVLVRESDGVEAEFTRALRTVCAPAGTLTPRGIVAQTLNHLQHCWLDRFRGLQFDERSTPDGREEHLFHFVKTQLAQATDGWVAAMLPQEPSTTFPRPRHSPRGPVSVHTSLLDNPPRQQARQ